MDVTKKHELLALSMSKGLKRELRIAAARCGVSMSQFVRRILQEYVAELAKEAGHGSAL